MFELAFSEILLVLIIALIVIGPERLPEVARGIGKAIGSVKRFIDNVRNETSLQDEIADLRRQLDISKEVDQLRQLGNTIESDIRNSVDEVDYSIYNRPSSDEIRRQHREAAEQNANAHKDNEPLDTENTDKTTANSDNPLDDDSDLENIQRPTFGREMYEQLPPWYHQQSEGAMTPKIPETPEQPVKSTTNKTGTHSEQTEKTA